MFIQHVVAIASVYQTIDTGKEVIGKDSKFLTQKLANVNLILTQETC
jgi:hypothetical protein